MDSLFPVLASAWTWALLVFGFGFVIFWHELGHFLAAKWAGIKVEQFAVGFGQALVSYRKGMGAQFGSTQAEYHRRIKEHVAKTDPSALQMHEGEEMVGIVAERRAAAAIGVSETEYRWNWIPLGGYVKMLGQDDLKPLAHSEDERAYNRKSVGARMVVVSAGVAMNIILAAIGFMVVFLAGFSRPPTLVGTVMPDSPAQRAGIEVGDRILRLDGDYQADFAKLTLSTALVDPTRPIPIEYEKPDGQVKTGTVSAARLNESDSKGFLMLGVTPAWELRGPSPEAYAQLEQQKAIVPPAAMALRPGDQIVAIAGRPTPDPKQFYLLDRAINAARGQPVPITVRSAGGAERTLQVQPVFMPPFSDKVLNFAGLTPRPTVDSMIAPTSPAVGKLVAGDVILRVSDGENRRPALPNEALTVDEFRSFIADAAGKERAMSVTVLRDGREVTVEKLEPTYRVDQNTRGLGVKLGYDEQHPVVGGTLQDTPAAAAGIPSGSLIAAIDGKPVRNWYDVNYALAAARPGADVAITVEGRKDPYVMRLDARQVETLAANRLTHELAMHELLETRHTSNPLRAAWWGVGETRDAVLQVYLTVKRMFQGSIDVRNVSGPVGIFAAGYRFADKGTIWLIWFMSIISANLAVMNFLPIPIVDGGLFTFLVIEKIKGGPVSPKVQAVAQVVGLAILLSVFLFATYQDIVRLPFMGR